MDMTTLLLSRIHVVLVGDAVVNQPLSLMKRA
jgi:hypothetical protein